MYKQVPEKSKKRFQILIIVFLQYFLFFLILLFYI